MYVCMSFKGCFPKLVFFKCNFKFIYSIGACVYHAVMVVKTTIILFKFPVPAHKISSNNVIR